MRKVQYLELARKDYIEIVTYITFELNAIDAANRFIDMFEKAVERVRQYPFSCKVFETSEMFHYEYRVFKVMNYLVFYVIFEEFIEIHRIIYAKMNLTFLQK